MVVVFRSKSYAITYAITYVSVGWAGGRWRVIWGHLIGRKCPIPLAGRTAVCQGHLALPLLECLPAAAAARVPLLNRPPRPCGATTARPR